MKSALAAADVSIFQQPEDSTIIFQGIKDSPELTALEKQSKDSSELIALEKITKKTTMVKTTSIKE